MPQASDILRMIEEVDPEDDEGLHEIEIAVYKYLGKDPAWAHNAPMYTRSRDALKSIRPEGWTFDIGSGPKEWHCEMSPDHTYVETINSKVLPTEELAELHAIIQAIEWEKEHE